MKKLAVMFSILVLLCSCGKSTEDESVVNTMEGTYFATNVSVEDWNMEPEEIGNGIANIYVTGVDDNSISSLNLYMDNELSRVTGYIATSSENDETIQYKFHIMDNNGVSIEDEDWFYLLYSPLDNTIKLELTGDIKYTFSK